MKGRRVINCLIGYCAAKLGARDRTFCIRGFNETWLMSIVYERHQHTKGRRKSSNADANLKRILFLEGQPDMRRDGSTGPTAVPDMLPLI